MGRSLPDAPDLDAAERSRLAEDYARFRRSALPANLTEYVLNCYGIALDSRYGPYPIKNPFGKASGQLSLQASQVRADADAGLGFVVLKTVIAQDASGSQSMSAWAIHETRMVPERIVGQDGTQGWTITWKGRGWSGTFDEYLALFRDALRIGAEAGMLVVPSCKYHLPERSDERWRTEEYAYTTVRLLEVWQAEMGSTPMPIEKDFSPTLAGDDRSGDKARILDWVRSVPAFIREAVGVSADGSPRVQVGLKLMNAMFDDEFQLEMLRAAAEVADWIVYANRLFDPIRAFDGKVGVAYGGPDLSARNLRVLSAVRAAIRRGEFPDLPPISATGNILTGRTAVEYALAGAESFQMHTLFQLPSDALGGRRGSKSARALNWLLFEPTNGFLAWMCYLRRRLELRGSSAFCMRNLLDAVD